MNELTEADSSADRDHLVLAERRGDWTTVILSGDSGFSGLCTTDARPGWFRWIMIGSAGVATGLDPIGARGVTYTDGSTATVKLHL